MPAKRTKPTRMPRRKFLQMSAVTLGAASGLAAGPENGVAQTDEGPPAATKKPRSRRSGAGRPYNSEYAGEYLNRVAFPLGGIGAGMICLEGTGALSHVSLRNRPEVA